MAKSPRDSSSDDSPDPAIGGGPSDPSSGDAALDGRDQLIAELEEAIQRRDDFLAVAAHELRNPLTPILLCVQYIRTAELAGNHALAISELDRLQRLVQHFIARTNTLLEVAQVTSHKFRIEVSELNLSELVEAIVEDHRPMLNRSGSELSSSIQPGVIAHLDRLAVSEIVENLLSNAIKYGQHQPITLSLTASGDLVRIVMQDRGIGISDQIKERIFGRFERAVGKEVQSGFGIGLWLSRNLAQQMGGSIEVAGESGIGSVFTVTLPINAAGKP
jgi:signal transduction histidine kinase